MGGDGSESNPYIIRDDHELQLVTEHLDANYKLGRDIDASGTVNWNNGQGFNPIGGSFTGSFDGQNHTISNLSINRLDDNNVGLFGRIGAGGEVKNVGVINVNITGGEKVGGLVGKNDNGNISNSYSTGNVTGELTGNVTGEKQVGGLVGYNYDGTVSNSYWDKDSTGQSSSAGLPDSNGLTTSQMQGSSASSNMNFEFTSTWSTVTGDYPELKWQE